MDLKDLFKDVSLYIDKEITVSGWIKNHRKQKDFGFIDFSDGTCFNHLQVVYDNSLANFDEISKLHIGSAVSVTGKIIKSSGQQDIEMKVEKVVLEGECSEDYPLQAKRHSREFLREIAYLRPRTNLFQAVFRIRSLAAAAIHQYFQEKGFVYLHAPLITGSDCEGAGEMFQVTTLDLEKLNGKVDYEKDFFGKKASLTVSGQLQGEIFFFFFKKI